MLPAFVVWPCAVWLSEWTQTIFFPAHDVCLCAFVRVCFGVGNGNTHHDYYPHHQVLLSSQEVSGRIRGLGVFSKVDAEIAVDPTVTSEWPCGIPCFSYSI